MFFTPSLIIQTYRQNIRSFVLTMFAPIPNSKPILLPAKKNHSRSDLKKKLIFIKSKILNLEFT